MSGHENERLSAYLDGELEPSARAQVEAHLAACPACAARLAEWAAVADVLASLPMGAPEGTFDTFSSRVGARLRAVPAARPRGLPAWTWAVAAAVLLAVVTPLTLQREPSPVRDRDAARERGAPSAPVTPPASAPAFAPPPAASPLGPREEKAVADGRREVDKTSRNQALAEAVPAPPGETAQESLARRKDARADRAEPEATALEAREAFAAPESPAPARQAAPASAPVASSARDEVSASGAPASPEATAGFQAREAIPPSTAAQWRERRDAWSAFATGHPADPRADEARVRAIEAAREAWLLGGDAADEVVFRREARAYLEREDARQKDRVRALAASERRP